MLLGLLVYSKSMGASVERVVVSARERSAGQDSVAGSAFPGRGLAAVDFVQMERTVSAAFAARGLQHLFSFVKRD